MVAKRVSIDWKFQPKKCSKRYKGDDDRISQLPDDILVSILCLLPMKEAARTSVLSSCWINLWKHIACLDFDAESALVKIAKDDKLATLTELLNIERGKYVKWVNSVLQSHKSPTLKEFRICFDFSKSATDAIAKWLDYAFSRQVQRLEFDLSPASTRRTGCPDKNYVFPEEFHLRKHFDFKYLKALTLKYVTVTREAIEFFLNNCPLLEKLILDSTEKMLNLEVCGSSLALKHLELCFCYGLEFVKVSAPNLTSLTINVFDDLVLENVPMLDELNISCGFNFSFNKLCPAISCCISQLESLTLLLNNLKGSNELSKFPEMPRLKKLVIDYWTHGDESLMVLTPLITASPNLQEFALKINGSQLSRSDREVESMIIRFPHEHLKVVKFCCYYGRSSDAEFVRYFIDNCVVLEKVIIDPHYHAYVPRVPTAPAELAEEITARDCARRQLEAQVPAHIELVIL